MPYLDDLIAQDSSREIISVSKSHIEIATDSDIRKLFPDTQIANSKNICYFPFNLCSSLPIRNLRGRAFTPAVLEHSFASLHDQLIDMDHLLKEQNTSPEDKIVGFVKDVRFNPPSIGEVANEIKIPASVTGLGVLFLRADGVKSAVLKHFNKEENWMVSMECGHSWKDAYFMYRGEFIPVVEAEVAMRNCVGYDHVKPYKGEELTACLGGLDGKVDFWGAAITKTPADHTADIPGFFVGASPEISNKKRFFTPFEIFTEKELEVASTTVDKKLDEIVNDVAKIEVIGATSPGGEDGHTHQILSNGSIFPTNGHTHSVREFSLTVGNKPSYSGITQEHYTYSEESRTETTHTHLFDIPLKKKKSSGGVDPEVGSLSLELDEEANMKLEEFLKKFDTYLESQGDSKETASMRSELNELRTKDLIEKENKEYVERLIESGELIKKEVAEESQKKAVEEAVDEVNKEHKKENQIKDKINSRINQCVENNINLDAVFEGVTDKDGNEMTIRKKVEATPVDEDGDRAFTMDLKSWVGNPLLSTKEEEEEGEITAESTESEEVTAAAANAPKQKKNNKVLPVGSKTNSEGKHSETASAEEEEEEETPKHLLGKGLFK